MGRRSLAFLGVLLVALVAVAVVVNRDSIQGVASNADISLSADESQYILGQTVVFTGSLAFAEGETAAVSRVRLLNTQGPQALDLDLPVADTAGQFIDISTQVAGTLLLPDSHLPVLPASKMPWISVALLARKQRLFTATAAKIRLRTG